MARMIVYPETVQYRQIVSDINRRKQDLKDNRAQPSSIFKFVGTVKLHGCNSAIGYSTDVKHWCQSRNRVITPAEDHAGFAQYIDPLAESFLMNHVLPSSSTIREYHESGAKIVIFGEWCGDNIQSNVALCHLRKMFVIFKIRIIPQNSIKNQKEYQQATNTKPFWLEPSQWVDIKWHERFIYNIYEFPTYEISIDFDQPELSQELLTNITEQVERECPVGAYFNIKGIGEGVVWTEWAESQGDLIFKVKGRQHMISQSKLLVPAHVTKVVSMNEFLDYACTEIRMRQALDYMREQKVPIEAKNAKVFFRWLAEDIIKEEKDVMDASGINVKLILGSIAERTHEWFKESVIRCRQVSEKKRGNAYK